jgi:GNAT superfamily N-acetyltransferase
MGELRAIASLHVQLLAVTPTARRQGVGRALMDAACSLAWEVGAEVTLDANTPELVSIE